MGLRTGAVIAAALLALSLLLLPAVVEARQVSVLTVSGQDQNGNPLTGFSVNINDPTGAAVATAAQYSTYSLSKGWLYSVQVSNAGSCSFAYWVGPYITSNPLLISITGDTQLVAVFNCSGSNSVVITSQGMGGAPITGYYTVLYGSTGTLMGTGFTPSTFNISPGNSYWVQADSFGSCTFLHWSDLTTANPRPVSSSGGTVLFTAVYGC